MTTWIELTEYKEHQLRNTFIDMDGQRVSVYAQAACIQCPRKPPKRVLRVENGYVSVKNIRNQTVLIKVADLFDTNEEQPDIVLGSESNEYYMWYLDQETK